MAHNKNLKVHLGSHRHPESIRVQETNWCCCMCHMEFVPQPAPGEGHPAPTGTHEPGRPQGRCAAVGSQPKPRGVAECHKFETCYKNKQMMPSGLGFPHQSST